MKFCNMFSMDSQLTDPLLRDGGLHGGGDRGELRRVRPAVLQSLWWDMSVNYQSMMMQTEIWRFNANLYKELILAHFHFSDLKIALSENVCYLSTKIEELQFLDLRLGDGGLVERSQGQLLSRHWRTLSAWDQHLSWVICQHPCQYHL